MKTKYINDDELIYNLPDFILGEELEANIREKIENKLRSDKSFLAEYERIKETYEYIKDVETDKAPANYFSSLLPRIHERIESEKTQKSFLYYLIHSWKIAVPALTVILLLMIFNKSDKIENINRINNISQLTETLPADSNIKESTEVSKNPEVSAGIEVATGNDVIPGTEINTMNTENFSAPVKQKIVITVEEENTSILNESIFGETEEDEFYYDDEFINMNASEQTELINNLKNTKF